MKVKIYVANITEKFKNISKIFLKMSIFLHSMHSLGNPIKNTLHLIHGIQI